MIAEILILNYVNGTNFQYCYYSIKHTVPKNLKKSLSTVVCKKVHKIASVWCKIALEEVGVSLP